LRRFFILRAAFLTSYLFCLQWSSPLSGPKRFEYDDKDKVWISTKDGIKLGFSLSEEVHHVYPDLGKLNLDV